MVCWDIVDEGLPDTPGIEIQPVATMASERTNATFYDNVEVEDQWRLGEVDDGWSVMGIALALERGVMGGTNPAVPLLHFCSGAGLSQLPWASIPLVTGGRVAS